MACKLGGNPGAFRGQVKRLSVDILHKFPGEFLVEVLRVLKVGVGNVVELFHFVVEDIHFGPQLSVFDLDHAG